MPRSNELDLLIVGGGPAGLATAIRAAQQGLAVRLLDARKPPIDKACGEGLMPDGLARLKELGIELPPEQRAIFRGIRYLDGDLVAQGEFPGCVGQGIRRNRLHRALVERAGALGVDLRFGVAVRALTPDGVRTDDSEMQARYRVGADGLHSRVRRWTGLDRKPSGPRRYGIRRHFALEPWTDFVEVYWSRSAEAYVTPVGPGSVGVAMLWSGGPARFDGLLKRFPALEARLAGAEPVSEDRGAGPLHQRLRGVVRGSVALVGDAAGYLDAITGEGLSIAFHQAFALVEAIEHERLEEYVAAHRRISRMPDRMTRLLLFVERHPWLRRRVFGSLAADPALFSRLLAIHARAHPAGEPGLRDALGIASRLLLRRRMEA